MTTNTLVITGLDRADFVEPATKLNNLQQLINKQVRIVHWAPLKSFRRILAVFESLQDATTARETILAANKLVLEADSTLTGNPKKEIKAYFYTSTPCGNSEACSEVMHLHPPPVSYMLISPPPSPLANGQPGPVEYFVGYQSCQQFENKLDNDIIMNVDAFGDTLANTFGHSISEPHALNSTLTQTLDQDSRSLKSNDWSDSESVNSLELDPQEHFYKAVQAALAKLQEAQNKRRESNISIKDINKNNSSSSSNEDEHEDPVITVQTNEHGKLTRRMTLQEPLPLYDESTTFEPSSSLPPFVASSQQSSSPRLTLKTDAKTLTRNQTFPKAASPVLSTPTIILEWDEE